MTESSVRENDKVLAKLCNDILSELNKVSDSDGFFAVNMKLTLQPKFANSYVYAVQLMKIMGRLIRCERTSAGPYRWQIATAKRRISAEDVFKARERFKQHNKAEEGKKYTPKSARSRKSAKKTTKLKSNKAMPIKPKAAAPVISDVKVTSNSNSLKTKVEKLMVVIQGQKDEMAEMAKITKEISDERDELRATNGELTLKLLELENPAFDNGLGEQIDAVLSENSVYIS